ncbi:MAG: helix-turn-helix transcriptional regulator [Bacteroidia bacterium]
MSKNLNITAVYIKLGKSIKINRLKCGLTLEQLAYEIGVQKSDIFSIEKGRNITTLTLIKIATVLNIHLKDLFDFNYNVTLNDIDKIVQKKQRKRK